LELHHEIVPHPPYSPDLALADYLFPNMKKWLAGKKFESNYEVIDQTNVYFAELNKSHFMNRIKKIENLGPNISRMKGDHVEK